MHAYESCADYMPLGEPGESPDIAGCVNILTNKRYITPTSTAMSNNSCLIQVEKWEGDSPMKKWHLIIDVARCHDCNDCFLADKDEFVGNEFPPYSAAQPWHGHRWMNIKRKERGQYPMVQTAYLPTPCMHCDDAPCLTADGAVYKRDDGLVIIDPAKAAGRKEIVASCPYGVICWNDEKHARPEVHRLRSPDRRGLAGHAVFAGVPHGSDQARARRGGRDRPAAGRRRGLETFRPELSSGRACTTRTCTSGRRPSWPARWSPATPTSVPRALRRRVTRDGRTVGEATTNNYGDFVVDGLEPGGRYTVTVQAAGYRTARLPVTLTRA